MRQRSRESTHGSTQATTFALAWVARENRKRRTRRGAECERAQGFEIWL